jgi:hypothetical protein
MDDNFEFKDGAALDTRPDEAKEKDMSQVETVSAAAPVQWVEKKPSEWRNFTKQDQDGSGSCVMQTVRKLAQILLWLKEKTKVEFSAAFYQLRSNRPDGGMIGVEAFDIWKNEGVPLEALVESDHMNDAQMDAVKIDQYKKDVAKVFRIANHLGLPNGDFERVASTIQQTGKGIMVWFYFTSEEWKANLDKANDFSIPEIKTPTLTIPTGSRHSVAAVDFFLYKGKKYILCEDSALFGGVSRRLISEDFFKRRNWFIRYPTTFRFQDSTQPQPEPTPVPQKPTHTFTKPLVFIPLDANGNISNLALHESQKADVVKLQDILRYEGTFPVNVDSTGYYGATTARAVYNYQKKHAVAPAAELDSLQGRRVGEKTIASLNSKYSN